MIARDPENVDFYYGRALDYMLVQDFSEAIKNYSKVLDLDQNFVMAYFNRAVVRYKQLEYNMSHQAQEDFEEKDMNLTMNMGNTSMVVRKPSTNDLTSVVSVLGKSCNVAT